MTEQPKTQPKMLEVTLDDYLNSSNYVEYQAFALEFIEKIVGAMRSGSNIDFPESSALNYLRRFVESYDKDKAHINTFGVSHESMKQAYLFTASLLSAVRACESGGSGDAD